MRKPLIAANWKMHSPPAGWDNEDSPYRSREGVDVVVFPTFLDIRTCIEKFLTVGAQFGRPEENGAFTGDVSMQLLASHSCTYVLCGHSERRRNHLESNTFIAEQLSAAVKAGLHPILCIGETAEERDAGKAEEVVQSQLLSSQISDLRSPISIAYEPVWAIGNGNSAAAMESQKMHAFIRNLLPENIRNTTRILYGGSVKPENAKEILAQPDIDGALVGASSLDPRHFAAILDSLPPQ